MVVCSFPPPVSVQFSDMKANKSGSMATGVSNVQTKVTGWTADGAFPGTVITSDALVPNGTKTSAIVATASVSMNGYTNGQLFIKVNGTVVASSPVTAFAYNTIQLTCQCTRTLNPGDTVEMYYASSDGFIGGTVNAAGTYFKIE